MGILSTPGTAAVTRASSDDSSDPLDDLDDVLVVQDVVLADLHRGIPDPRELIN